MNKAPWTLGFRPFFLLASISGSLLLALWLLIYHGLITPQSYYAPSVWHGHEMLFGFVGAILAGFLLTAAHNWTGLPTLHGRPLMLLCLLWLLARLAPFTPLPNNIIAMIDVLFLPLLALAIAIPIIKSKLWNNLGFPVLLLILTVANALVHAYQLGSVSVAPMVSLVLGVDVVLLIIVWIFGRIYPFFSGRVLAAGAVRTVPWVEHSALLILVLVAASRLFLPQFTTGLLLVAALIHARRLLGFHHRSVWGNPLIWILFTGYAWLVVGLLLEALQPWTASLLPISPLLVRHVYTVGAIGLVTIGMMVRVSLGHTGRPLKVGRTTIACFVMINLAVSLRVFGPMFVPQLYTHWVLCSGLLWVIAFSLFVGQFARLLLAPRPDGKPG